MKAIILSLVSVLAICALLVSGIVLTSQDRLKVESSEIDIKTMKVINSLDCVNDITRVFDKYGVQIFDKKHIDGNEYIEISFENPSDNLKLDKFNEESSLILDNSCKVD